MSTQVHKMSSTQVLHISETVEEIKYLRCSTSLQSFQAWRKSTIKLHIWHIKLCIAIRPLDCQKNATGQVWGSQWDQQCALPAQCQNQWSRLESPSSWIHNPWDPLFQQASHQLVPCDCRLHTINIQIICLLVLWKTNIGVTEGPQKTMQ
jgi:hypothetical protein